MKKKIGIIFAVSALLGVSYAGLFLGHSLHRLDQGGSGADLGASASREGVPFFERPQAMIESFISGKIPECARFASTSRAAIVQITSCYFPDEPLNSVALAYYGNCFLELPQLLTKIRDIGCKKKISLLIETVLDDVVANQFHPKHDLSFNTSASSSSSGSDWKSKGFDMHLRWMSRWKNTQLEHSTDERYIDEVYRLWSNKLGRILAQDHVLPKGFEEKIDFASAVFQLILDQKEAVHPEFIIRFLVHTIDLLQERMDLWKRIHGVNCTFMDCSLTQESPDLASLVWVLGHFFDSKPQIPAYVGQSSPQIQNLVNALIGIQPQIVAEIRSAAAASDGELQDETEFSTPWRRLRMKSHFFRKMSDLYAKKGIFEDPTQTLLSGLTEGVIQHTVTTLQKIMTSLTQVSAKVAADRAGFFQNLIAEGHQEEKTIHLNNELKRKTKELGHLLDQLQATQYAFQSTERELGDRAKGLLKELDSTVFKRELNEESFTRELVIAPSQVPQPGNFFTPGAGFKVSKGDLVQIEVVGQWAPVCAIQKDDPLSGGLTGPEGYLQSVQNSKAVVKQIQEFENQSQFESTDNTHTVCKGWNKSQSDGPSFFKSLLSVGANIAGLALAPATGGASLAIRLAASAGVSTGINVLGSQAIGGDKQHVESDQNCQSSTRGKRREAGTNKSVSQIDTSNIQTLFQLGLKSKHAPLPDYPAGALLIAHEVQYGDQKEYSLQVAQKNNSILIPTDGVIQFMVNDCLGPAPIDPGSLRVVFKRLEPKSKTVKLLIDSLELVLQKLRERAPQLVAMKSLSPEDWSEVRTRIFADLAQTTKELNQGMPESIEKEFSSFLNHWIETAIAQVSKKMRMMHLLEQGDLLADQVGELQEALARARSNQRIIDAPLYWAELGLELSQKNEIQEMKQFFTFFEERLNPILSILFSHAKSSLSQDFRFKDLLKFPSLRNHYGTELNQISDQLVQMGEALSAKLAETEAVQVRDLFTVALRMPDPDLLTIESHKIMPLADHATTVSVWDAIRGKNNDDLILRITPTSIYKGASSCSSLHLNLNRSTAVVQGMSLVFKVDNTKSIVGKYKTLSTLEDIEIPKTQLFILKNGYHSFHLHHPFMNRIDLPVFKINSHEDILEVSELMAQKSGIGRGLSPFGDFKISGDHLRTVAESVTKNRIELIHDVYWVINLKANLEAQNLPIRLDSEAACF